MNESQEDAAARVHRLLRHLPSRRAPSTLEERVRGQIERRFAPTSRMLSMRHGFRHWPLWGRAGFFALTAALVGYSALDVPWRLAARPVEAAAAVAAAWLHPALTIGASAGTLTHGLIHWLPPEWLAGLAGVVAALYALLFALGAAAYRTLYVQSPRFGDSA